MENRERPTNALKPNLLDRASNVQESLCPVRNIGKPLHQPFGDVPAGPVFAPTRWQDSLVHYKTNMASAATAITAVASQPMIFSPGGAMNSPRCFRFEATIIVATINGTAITPFNTALQNNALIGSIGRNNIRRPRPKASAMTP